MSNGGIIAVFDNVTGWLQDCTASWRAGLRPGPYPASDCHVGLKRREWLPISVIIRRTWLTCGMVLCTDQTLWISVEYQSRIMCEHMRACARMCAYALGTCQSSPETAKIRKWENMKVRKDGKNLLGLLSSGRLRYMISYMISRNYDIAYDIICLKLSMIS